MDLVGPALSKIPWHESGPNLMPIKSQQLPRCKIRAGDLVLHLPLKGTDPEYGVYREHRIHHLLPNFQWKNWYTTKVNILVSSLREPSVNTVENVSNKQVTNIKRKIKKGVSVKKFSSAQGGGDRPIAPPSTEVKWPSISSAKFSGWWSDKLCYKSFELREAITLVTISF